jgi:DNA-binding transcriptional regulator YdaS (Cro superfamily)
MHLHYASALPMMAGMSAIERIIKHFGSQAALAGELGVAQPTVSEWLRGDRPIPSERRAEMERVSAGTVRCEEFGDDIAWARIPDKSWPWHPKGRPALDVTKVAA